MRGFILLLILTLLQPLAVAAPWIQDQGSLYTRIAIASEDVEGLSAVRGDAYAEYGFTDDWTLTGKLEGVAFEEGASDFNRQGWRVMARRRLFKQGNFLGAIEVGALQGEAIGGANGCETLGVETRAGVAWSGKWRKTETYSFVEIAGRFHDNCHRERFEFGLGQKMTKNIWLVSQVWVERGDQNAKSDKTQTELMWKANSWETSLGYRQELGGQFEEQSVFLALAKKY